MTVPGCISSHRAPQALARVLALTLILVLAILAGAETSLAEDQLPESNVSLLHRTLRMAAAELLEKMELQPGTRVVIQTDDDRPIDEDAERAFLAGLTERRIEAWALPADASSSPAPRPSIADTLGAAGSSGGITFPSQDDDGSGSSNNSPSRSSANNRGIQDRSEMVHLPLLAYHVEEARVDYPRLFRSGIFGGQHVERRAIARITVELHRPDSRAIYWVGSADTSFSDIVKRSELSILEDATRPEARGTVPQQNWTKIAEPVLVVVLVVGLVALFYTNRP